MDLKARVKVNCEQMDGWRMDRWMDGQIGWMDGQTKNQTPGLEKSSVLPDLDRFLKLKTDLFLDKC